MKLVLRRLRYSSFVSAARAAKESSAALPIMMPFRSRNVKFVSLREVENSEVSTMGKRHNASTRATVAYGAMAVLSAVRRMVIDSRCSLVSEV